MSSSPRSQTAQTESESPGSAEKVTNGIANQLFGSDRNPEEEEQIQSNHDDNRSQQSASTSVKSHSASKSHSTANKGSIEYSEPSLNEEEEGNANVADAESNSKSNNEEEAYYEYQSSVSRSQKTSTSLSSSGKKSTYAKRRTAKRQKANEPPQEEVDAALDLLLHGVPPEDFDPATLKCCIRELQKLKKDSVMNKNYREANYYSELIKASNRAADVAGFSSQCTQKLGYLKAKQMDAQEKVDDINDYYIQQFQEFEEMIDSKMQAMTDQQKQELEEFDRNIPDDLPPKYLKHSDAYVQLRKKEKLLIRNEDYLAADEVKTKADALEQEELAKQNVKMQDDLQKERNALVKKHNQQYSAFALWVDARRHEMLTYRDKELEGPVRRLEYYTNLINKIEKKGFTPNPLYGYTTNRVTQKESIRAVKIAAQTPVERDSKLSKTREKQIIPNHRPLSSMRTQKLNRTTGSRTGKNSQRSNLPPV